MLFFNFFLDSSSQPLYLLLTRFEIGTGSWSPKYNLGALRCCGQFFILSSTSDALNDCIEAGDTFSVFSVYRYAFCMKMKIVSF